MENAFFLPDKRNETRKNKTTVNNGLALAKVIKDHKLKGGYF